MNIAIIGGGIGGLCVANTLFQQSISFTVYEAASTIEPIGAGIGIGSNAMAALMALHVGENVYKYGATLHTQEIRDVKNRLLNTLDFSFIASTYGEENTMIHRADLHKSLYDALPVDSIHLNKKCVHVEQLATHCLIYFADGTTAQADFVIAADGIHSSIRQSLIPHSTPKYAGYTCWRGIATMDSLTDNHKSVEYWGTTGRFGFAPLGQQKVYWFACVNARENDIFLQNLQKEQIVNLFQQFPHDVKQILLATNEEDILHHDLYDLKPLKKFHFNRIVLFGDAAHATTPNMGQGAGQAIEDGLCFGEALKNTQDFFSAAQQFERKRRKHTAKVTTLSRQIGWASQWENRALATVRNQIFSIIPSKFLLKRIKFLFEQKH